MRTAWLVLLLLAPTAGAQLQEFVDISFDAASDMSIAPGTEAAQTYTYRWRCATDNNVRPPGPVTLNVSTSASQPGVTGTAPESITLPDDACLTKESGSGTIEAIWRVAATVPGGFLEGGHLAIHDARTAGATISASSVRTNITTTYLGDVRVLEAGPVSWRGPFLTFTVRLENHGNGPATVAFNASVQDPAIEIQQTQGFLVPWSPEGTGNETVSVTLTRPVGHAVDGLVVSLAFQDRATAVPGPWSPTQTLAVEVLDDGFDGSAPSSSAVVGAVIAAFLFLLLLLVVIGVGVALKMRR